MRRGERERERESLCCLRNDIMTRPSSKHWTHDIMDTSVGAKETKIREERGKKDSVDIEPGKKNRRKTHK